VQAVTTNNRGNRRYVGFNERYFGRPSKPGNKQDAHGDTPPPAQPSGPPRVFVQDSDFTLHVGDALEVLAGLPDESVHCVVTSPPYWGLRDYGTGSWDGGDPDCDHLASNYDRGVLTSQAEGAPNKLSQATADKRRTPFKSVCGKCGATRVDQQLGLEATPDLFVQRIVDVFREVRRVLRSDGTCWVNLGDSYVSNGFWPDAPSSQNESKSRSHARGARGRGVTRPPSSDMCRCGRPIAHVEHLCVAGFTHTPVPTRLKPKDLVGIPWRVAFALQQPYYTGRIKDERDRIWLAATVEAEGCMFIHKRGVGQYASSYTKSDGTESHYHRKNATYGAGLEVSSTDRAIVERCMEITGIGSICEQTPAQNERRKQTIYRWNVRSNECRWVIRELYPHMIAKQHEARLILGCPSSGDDARKAHESLKAIHQGLTPSIDFAPPEGMWERGWFLRSDVIWAKLDGIRCRRA
jgi:hypothetical protein